jgi:hypothetical protein
VRGCLDRLRWLLNARHHPCGCPSRDLRDALRSRARLRHLGRQHSCVQTEVPAK